MSTFNDTQNQILPYKECKDIYRTTTLGKRIVEGLPNFAMSTQREIDIHKAPPEAIEKFKETASEMKQDEAIKKTIYNARIYGTGALYIAMYNEEEDKDDFTTKPTFEDAYKYKIKFTVFDPLNISGARVDLDPLSFHFLEVVDIQVNSKKIPKKRIAISHALEPLYLDTRTSLIPYSPPSVFYNMVELLKQYDDAIKSIGDLLYKAGAIIYKYPVKSKLTGVTLDAITASGNILEQKRSGEVISISNDSTVEDFPIANLNGLIDSINKLEDDITKALSDTPVSILFDRNLSNGFSEGDKDKDTVISTIESFRENKLTPLYNLTDYYIMLKAWDRAFIDEMRYKYSEYKDKTDNEIFRSWAENFKFKYGNLFPEPESVIQDNNAKKLDNLLKAQQLGANSADLQEELNESEIFKNEMELNPQNIGGMEDDEDVFDYNNIDSEIKTDASPIPPGTNWKTLDNGEHILVNENGTVFAGAEGALKGKYYKDKETGRFKKYTFNQQSLAAEDEKRYNESKENESSNDKKEKEENKPQNNTESTINNQKEEAKKEENNKDNSNPKKSNCNIGDTYNIAINSMATIPAKKLFESDNYELYEENTNKLKPQQLKAIENAINNISKQYNELFNIYGKSDNQPTKKLKIVLLDESRKKQLKSTAGFVIKEGANNEEDNSIFLNTSIIKKAEENNIQKIIAHETIHTIINDNLRNKKMYFRPSNLLEEALAESGTFTVDGDNYREPPEDLDIGKKTKWILHSKYYFTSNLMHYLYLKNNKNSDIFKDIVNNMQGKEDSKFTNAIEKTANKIGIEGDLSEIIKYWIKDKYNFNDEEANDFKRTLMIKLNNPKW